jgi:hypothetical protein
VSQATRPALFRPLVELEALRGQPIVVYNAMVEDDTVEVLYGALRTLAPSERLGVVLTTLGGSITTARRLVLLLREYASHLTILVPRRARSAGTLMCLGASELVMAPAAELSPIDASMDGADGSAGRLSAEDVRAFRAMADDWFGIRGEQDRVQVLALVAQRIFPGSLGALYRFDRLAHSVAHELLRHQLADVPDAIREGIVERLVSGYDSHDHAITRADAAALGLRVVDATAREEALLWDLSEACRREFGEAAERDEPVVTGLIAGGGRRARRLAGVEGPERRLRIGWEWDGA